jgi:hypothetical protein
MVKLWISWGGEGIRQAGGRVHDSEAGKREVGGGLVEDFDGGHCGV